MISRLFSLESDDAIVLQKIGAAVILQWSHIPQPVQEMIIQQAQAMDGAQHPTAVASSIRRMLGQHGVGGSKKK